MKNLVIIFALVAIFVGPGWVNAAENCKPNEVRKPCGPACEKTCSNPNPIVCPAICYLDACTCKEGFYRDSDKNCVNFLRCSTPKPKPKPPCENYNSQV